MVRRVTNKRNYKEIIVEPMLKRRTKKSRVAPFRNKDEFEKVYQLLFTAEQTPETRLKAYEILQIWKIRRGAETPASILSTLAILEAQIRDAGKSGEVTSGYAGAFTRFLNYVSSVEQKQQKRSMYSIANQLGIESFLVDLRHLCAHGQNTPSIEVFRRSATYCMNWLKGFYWERELKHIQDTDVNEMNTFNSTRFERILRRMTNIYDAASQGIQNGCTTVSELLQLVQDSRQPLLQEYIAQLNETNIRKICQSILVDLIAASKSRVVKESTHIFCEQLLSSPYFIELSAAGDPKVIGLHSRLLVEMQKCGYLTEFFYVSIHIAEDSFESNLKRKSAAYWAEKLLEANEIRQKVEEDDKKSLNERYKSAGFNPDQVIILLAPFEMDVTETFVATRIKNACYFTCKFLKRLLSTVESPVKYEKLKGLLEVFTNSDEEPAANDLKRKIYTVDDVIPLMNDAKKTKTEETPANIWTEATDSIDWKKIPLGKCFDEVASESD